MNRFSAVIERVGIGNGTGDLSFNKLVTITTLVLFWRMIEQRYDPAWPTLTFGIVLVGAGFGLKGYLGAIKQNRFEAIAQINSDARTNVDVNLTGDVADMVRAVKERRSTTDIEVSP